MEVQNLRDKHRSKLNDLEFEISMLQQKLGGADLDMAEKVDTYIREQRSAMNDQLDARNDDQLRALAVADREKKVMTGSYRDQNDRLKAELEGLRRKYQGLLDSGVADQATLDELDMKYKQSQSRMEDQHLALRAEIDRLQEELASSQNELMMSLGSRAVGERRQVLGELRPTYKDGQMVFPWLDNHSSLQKSALA